MLTHERRAGQDIRATIDESDSSLVLEGYAAVFDSIIELWEGQFEVIRKGAFTRTLNGGADVRALFNHDPNQILARTKNGTLALQEDDHGLHYRAVLNPNDAQAVDTHAKIARGDIDESSFAFNIDGELGVGEQFSAHEGGRLREVLRTRLHDVAPVTYPAYEDTEVVARAEVAFRNAPQDEPGKHTDAEPVFHSVPLLRRRLHLKEKEHGQ